MKKGQQHQVAKNYTHGREKVACTVKVDFMDYDMQKDKQPKKKKNKTNQMLWPMESLCAVVPQTSPMNPNHTIRTQKHYHVQLSEYHRY